jgi:hypothetical protein
MKFSVESSKLVCEKSYYELDEGEPESAATQQDKNTYIE